MGEAYPARDTRPQRDVAIKVLPDRLAENSHALARFEREARVVAALSHGFTNNRQFRASRDNRQIVFLRAENEADIWLMSPE